MIGEYDPANALDLGPATAPLQPPLDLAAMLRGAEAPKLPELYGEGPLAPSRSLMEAITPSPLEPLRDTMQYLLAADGLPGTVNGEPQIITRTSILYRPAHAPADVPLQRVRLAQPETRGAQPRIIFLLPEQDAETSASTATLNVTTTNSNSGALTFTDNMGRLRLVSTGVDSQGEFAASVKGDVAIAAEITESLCATYRDRVQAEMAQATADAQALADAEQALIDEEKDKRREAADAARTRRQERFSAIAAFLDKAFYDEASGAAAKNHPTGRARTSDTRTPAPTPGQVGFLIARGAEAIHRSLVGPREGEHYKHRRAVAAGLYAASLIVGTTSGVVPQSILADATHIFETPIHMLEAPINLLSGHAVFSDSSQHQKSGISEVKISKPLLCTAEYTTHIGGVTLNGEKLPPSDYTTQICTDPNVNTQPHDYQIVIPGVKGFEHP